MLAMVVPTEAEPTVVFMVRRKRSPRKARVTATHVVPLFSSKGVFLAMAPSVDNNVPGFFLSVIRSPSGVGS